MAKKQKGFDNQENLFDLLEKVEWQEEIAQVGDRIRFRSYISKRLEGNFVTCGFWDGRDQANPQYFFFDVGGKFVELSLYHLNNSEWARLGHDDSYVPPRKDDIAERLIERLRPLSFADRLSTYQAFKAEYPSLAFEYSPLLSEAWQKAIIEVTTEQDVMAFQDHWKYIGRLPAYVTSYIENVIFPLSGDARLEAMWSLRWVDSKKPDHGKYWIRYLPKIQMTYYKPLFSKLIRETQDVSMLKLLCRIWGPQGDGFLEQIPGLSWTITDGQEPKVHIPLVEQGELFDFDDEVEEEGEIEEDAEDWCGDDGESEDAA